MQDDIVNIKTLPAQVVERQDRAEVDITNLKARTARTEMDLAELKAGQRQTNRRLGNLIGSVYEQRIVKRFRSTARRRLDINGTQILQ